MLKDRQHNGQKKKGQTTIYKPLHYKAGNSEIQFSHVSLYY